MNSLRIVKTLKYMEPHDLGDGSGFHTVVQLADGNHFLISEIHRKNIDEVMVFRCSAAGSVMDWSEVYCERESTTESVVGAVSRWTF